MDVNANIVCSDHLGVIRSALRLAMQWGPEREDNLVIMEFGDDGYPVPGSEVSA